MAFNFNDTEQTDMSQAAGAVPADLDRAHMALGIAGAAVGLSVVGGAYALAAYALPVPVLGGTVVAGGLAYAGFKDLLDEEDDAPAATAKSEAPAPKAAAPAPVAAPAAPAAAAEPVGTGVVVNRAGEPVDPATL